jgi:hypothetical protein
MACRSEEALADLRRLNGGIFKKSAILQFHRNVLGAVDMELPVGAGSWKGLLKNDRIQSRKRRLIACAIQLFQQLGGINAIICGFSQFLLASVFIDLL